MKAKFSSEAELAALVVQWLMADGWEVFQEVHCGGSTCDIVGRRSGVLWAIECKLSLNLQVLSQATNWRWKAHLASVAVPHGPTTWAADNIARELGIGIISLQPEGHVVNSGNAKGTFRRPVQSIAKHLHEQQKTLVGAGGNRGGFYTPFKGTCQELLRVVKAQPGITLKAAIAGIKHHYSSDKSAVACIGKLAKGGIVPGIRIEAQGKGVVLYPA